MILLAAACSETGSESLDGGAESFDGSHVVVVCEDAIRECPGMRPAAESACDGDFTCDYGDAKYYCEQGRMREELLCPGCQPATAERCRDPSDARIDGATLTVGPATGAFRSYHGEDRLKPAWGSQGFAMIDMRIRVDAPDTPPPCVSVTIRGTIDAMEIGEQSFPVALRCGLSLRVLAILPMRPCEFRDYAVSWETSVAGVGATQTSITLEGGACPR